MAVFDYQFTATSSRDLQESVKVIKDLAASLNALGRVNFSDGVAGQAAKVASALSKLAATDAADNIDRSFGALHAAFAKLVTLPLDEKIVAPLRRITAALSKLGSEKFTTNLDANLTKTHALLERMAGQRPGDKLGASMQHGATATGQLTQVIALGTVQIKQYDHAVGQAQRGSQNWFDGITKSLGTWNTWNKALDFMVKRVSQVKDAFTSVFSQTQQIGGGFEVAERQLGVLTGAGKSAENKAAYDAVIKEAERIGADTEASATDAAAAAIAMSKAGMTVQQIAQPKALATVMDVSAGEGVNAGKVAEIGAIGAAQFSKTGALMGQETATLTDILKVYQAAAAASSTDITSLAESMKNTAPAATLLGMSAQETSAILMTLSQNGETGSRAGTRLMMALTRIANQTPQASKALAALGISFKDSAGNTLPFATILDSLKSKLAGVQGNAQKMTYLKQIFGESFTSMAYLVEQGGDTIKQKMQEITDSMDIGDALKGASTQGMTGAFARFQSSYEGVFTSLRKILSVPIAAYWDTLAGVINKVNDHIVTLGETFGQADTFEKWLALFKAQGIQGLFNGLPEELQTQIATLRELFLAWLTGVTTLFQDLAKDWGRAILKGIFTDDVKSVMTTMGKTIGGAIYDGIMASAAGKLLAGVVGVKVAADVVTTGSNVAAAVGKVGNIFSGGKAAASAASAGGEAVSGSLLSRIAGGIDNAAAEYLHPSNPAFKGAAVGAGKVAKFAGGAANLQTLASLGMGSVATGAVMSVALVAIAGTVGGLLARLFTNIWASGKEQEGKDRMIASNREELAVYEKGLKKEDLTPERRAQYEKRIQELETEYTNLTGRTSGEQSFKDRLQAASEAADKKIAAEDAARKAGLLPAEATADAPAKKLSPAQKAQKDRAEASRQEFAARDAAAYAKMIERAKATGEFDPAQLQRQRALLLQNTAAQLISEGFSEKTANVLAESRHASDFAKEDNAIEGKRSMTRGGGRARLTNRSAEDIAKDVPKEALDPLAIDAAAAALRGTDGTAEQGIAKGKAEITTQQRAVLTSKQQATDTMGGLRQSIITAGADFAKWLLHPVDQFKAKVLSLRESFGAVIDSLKTKKIDVLEKFGLQTADQAAAARRQVAQRSISRDTQLLQLAQDPEERQRIQERLAEKYTQVAETATGQEKTTAAQKAAGLFGAAERSAEQAQALQLKMNTVEQDAAKATVANARTALGESTTEAGKAGWLETLKESLMKLGGDNKVEAMQVQAEWVKAKSAAAEEQAKDARRAADAAEKQVDLLTQAVALLDSQRKQTSGAATLPAPQLAAASN